MADSAHTEPNESLGPKIPPVTSGESRPAAPAPASTVHAEPHAASPAPHQAGPNRRAIIGLVAIVLIAVAAYFMGPYVVKAFTTTSTDDAYVNSHVTYIAPRVSGYVEEVYVDDNHRVSRGQLLVRLDKVPYQVIVDAKRALLQYARANLNVAQDDFRALISKARASRFKLQHTIEDVDNQIALLRANVAKLARADADYKRALNLQKTPGVISEEEIDQRKEAYRVALEQVYQTRVSLGLPQQPEHGGDLSEVPADLDQTFSTVREAVSELQQAASTLGIVASSFDLRPKALLDEFYKRDPKGDVDKIYEKLTADAPSIKLAQAQVNQAQSDLDQAELNLGYCDIMSEIDGVVTRRDVNPGNNLVAGQSIMAVRSLTEIWIDANFKETQLADLRIGQSADLDVDMYGSKQTFKGRISGFTMGTGSTLAILPAENATGNFVKVVQRLPVRIELVDYDPDKDNRPLFVGLSVTPYVHINEKPTGPNAGLLLQTLAGDALPKMQEPQSNSRLPNSPPPKTVEKEQEKFAPPPSSKPITSPPEPSASSTSSAGKVEKKP